MSIKDRIAAANARAENDDDDLESLIDEIDSVSFGPDDEEDSGEPTPSWEKEEEVDDDGELEPDGELGDPEVDPTELEESDELSGDETPDEPQVSTVDTADTPSLDTLRRYGWPTEGLTEAQAARKLSVEFDSFVQHYNQNKRFIEVGQEVAPNIEKFRSFLGTGSGGTPATAPTQPAAAAPEPGKKIDLQGLLAKVGTIEKEPDIRPEWKSYVAQRHIIFDGEFYVPAPNAPHLANVAEKLNEHRDWERKMQARVHQLPDVMKELAQVIVDNQSSGAGLSMEQVEANLRERKSAADDAEFAQKILDRNKNWMFECSSKGDILKHPIHKTPILTKTGMRYYNELQSLHDGGMRDSKRMHYYALAALGKSLADETPNVQTPPTDVAGPASSAAGSTVQNRAAQVTTKPAASSQSPADRRVELLKKQRKQAARSANVVSSGEISDDGDAPRQVKRISLGAMLENDFVKSGIKPRRRKDEEDD